MIKIENNPDPAVELLLLVDDHQDNLTVMRKVLEKSLPQAEIVTIQNPEEVMDYVRTAEVSVAVFDVQMPGINGIELCAQLKASKESRHVPVILITSHEAPSDFKVKGMDAGADDFLTRPMDNDELVARVKVALRINRAETQLRRTANQVQQDYQMLFNKMNAGFAVHELIFDAEGKPVDYRFLSMNPAFEELMSLCADEIGGKTALEVLPELEPEWIDRYAQVVATSTPAHFESYTAALDRHYEVEAFCVGVNQFATLCSDITERKQAEKALRENEQEFRSTLSDLLVGVVVHAPDSSILLCNSQASNILGITREQITGKQAKDPDWHFVHADLTEMNIEDYPVNQVISTGKRIINQVLGVVRSDRAEPAWLLLTATPVFNDEKVLKRIVINFMDITERKKMEWALRKSEAMLNETGRMAKIGGWEIDLQSEKLTWTKEVYAIHEVAMDFQPSVERAINFYAPESKPIIQQAIERAIQDRVPFDIELELITARGRSIWVQSMGRAVFENNQATSISGMIQDITERKLAEEALRTSEEKFRALYDNAPLSYQSLDANGCFIDVNPTWLKTLGYERDEVIGARYADFLHPNWKPHFEKNFPAFKKRGYVHDVQFKIRHKDGHYLDIEFEGCIGYLPDGSFRQTYCVFQDITERKLAEKALRESEANFKAMAGTSPLAIYLSVGPNQVCEYVNPTFVELFGYTLQEVPSIEKWWSLAYPEPNDHQQISEEWAEKVRRAADTQTSIEPIEVVVTCKDGSQKNIRWGYISLGEKGYAYGLDLTENRRAEKELEQYRNHLEVLVEERTTEVKKLSNEQRTILDSVRAMIWYKDTENRFLRGNRAAAESVGLTVAELEGKTAQMLFPDEADHFYADDLEVIRSGKPKLGIVEPMRTANGKKLWVLTDKVPSHDGAGRVTGVIVFCLDITEQKLAEEEAARRTSDLQRIVKAMAGREVRMAELKKEMKQLRKQLDEAGIEPIKPNRP